ncbi:hypothetical protein GR702_21200 [Novosphingobium sp. FGD1]|uniref:Uncharacterized protein n=1 Tax=Novosphingobium silvae TaxID=2692619 RepID=A0A7X4GL67_9SPHN|nr:hypothetical protein [Novosphingobium silvae]MYM00265.1 hypothetical protein [Novosphingobium silvae]
MLSADELYMRFYDRLEGDSPFLYHEVASVGFLASSAAMAGYLPMNEYDVFKKGKLDKRYKERGRADLWFDAGDRCYSFEFKRTRRPVTMGYLEDRLNSALEDINCIYSEEYHYAAACLVTVATEPKRIAVCQDFGRSRLVDFAYQIGPVEEPAFLFFRLKV